MDWYVIGAAYAMGLMVALPLWAGDWVDGHDVVWWPIALIKALLKTLARVLLTGWRD